MAKLSIILCFSFYLLIHPTVNGQNFILNRNNRSFDYCVFDSKSAIYLAFNKQYKSNVLTNNQLLLAKSIIKKVSDSLNFLIIRTNVKTKKVDTLKHVFQIVSAKDDNGQNLLWINAICDPDKHWRERLMFFEDGGSCYYQFKINLTKRKYFDINVNVNE